jgi:hypothetical protein
MKKKIRFHLRKTWNCGFFASIKEITILPSITITYNPEGTFIESGVYAPMHLVNFKFLIWEFGFAITTEI